MTRLLTAHDTGQSQGSKPEALHVRELVRSVTEAIDRKRPAEEILRSLIDGGLTAAESRDVYDRVRKGFCMGSMAAYLDVTPAEGRRPRGDSLADAAYDVGYESFSRGSSSLMLKHFAALAALAGLVLILLLVLL